MNTMGKLEDWIDRPTQEREDILEILYDQAVSVDVYRVNEASINPGVIDEIDDAIFLRTINVRLDPPTTNQSNNTVYVALADDADVQINDRWRWTPRKDKTIMMIVLKATRMPRGYQVEVKNA